MQQCGEKKGCTWEGGEEKLPGQVLESSIDNPLCWTAFLTFTPRVEQKVDSVRLGLVNVRASLHYQAIYSHSGIGCAGDRQNALGGNKERGHDVTNPPWWHQCCGAEGWGSSCVPRRGVGGEQEIRRAKETQDRGYGVFPLPLCHWI